jgi:DNA-directed RNA polymerase subunit RPC12/RpoP
MREDTNSREVNECPHCGRRLLVKTATSTAGNEVPAWECTVCGVTVLDGAAAALNNSTYQSNEVRLFTDGKEICAMIGPDPVQGIAGYGHSVPEALRELADQLVKCGVWIEVTDPNHPFNWAEPSPTPD